MYEKSFMNQRLRKGEPDDKYRVKNGKFLSETVRFHSFLCENHANASTLEKLICCSEVLKIE